MCTCDWCSTCVCLCIVCVRGYTQPYDLHTHTHTHIDLQLGSVQTQMQSKGGFSENEVPSSLTPTGKSVVSHYVHLYVVLSSELD